MKYLALISIFILSLGFINAPVYAQAECTPIEGGPGGPGGGGSCDWSEAKAHITATESGGDYTRLGPRHSTMGYACGKYQFMETTIDGYIRSAPHCNGSACDDPTFSQCPKWRSEPCFCVQECFMDAMLADNLERIRNDPACQQLLNGGSINGCSGQGQTLSCSVTESGLLAAFHLGGTDECRKILANGCGDSDSTGTSTGYYTCKHGGLPVPGDCSPAEYGVTPGERPPTATWEQYQFMIESGDIPNIGFSILGSWVHSLAQMTEQLTVTMVQQVQVIGTFFDAKHQLETQRILRLKHAEAHKDYQPSEQMCEIGTFVRNLANTEERAVLTHTAMVRSMLDRALGTGDSQTSYIGMDEDTRLKAYIDKFCDIKDNAQQNTLLCRTSGTAEQQNADINFTQTIDAPLTIKLNLLDTTTEPGEESLFAFLDYIFMQDSFPWISAGKTKLIKFKKPYQAMRSLVAMRSVAQDSFAYIISEKTQSPDGSENVGPYMKSLLKEMGISEDEMEERLGDNPSYYAQMEMLTKIIYQNPEFISNLYDKPANVKRIRAAMTAIKLMQDRDIHKALMRREMLMSMLLELNLRKEQKSLSQSVDFVNSNPAGIVDSNGQIIQMGP